MVEAIEAGFPQREIMDAAYMYQRAVDAKDKIIVGVNEFVEENEQPLETLYIDESVEEKQKAALAALRRSRDGKAGTASLSALNPAGAGRPNVMPPPVRAVKTQAAGGAISQGMGEGFADQWGPSG